MNKYEMPENEACSENAKQASNQTDSPPYSLEDQVMRTSEAVERLANIFSDAIQVLSVSSDTKG